MRELVRRLAAEGITIMLSSHLLTEVEEVCNRVAIVRSGRIVYEGEIAELKGTSANTYTLATTDDDRALAVCRAQPGIADVRTGRTEPSSPARVMFTADSKAVAELSAALVEAGALILALTPQTASLEELFFSLTEGTEGGAAGAAVPLGEGEPPVGAGEPVEAAP